MSHENHDHRTAVADCAPPSPAVRNRYFRGKLMTVADYRTEQAYMIQRRRLINRTVLGWGVVSGFTVQRHGAALEIQPGVALDPQGREVVLCGVVRIDEACDLVWLAPGRCGLECVKPLPDGRYLLSAHYAECEVDGVRIDNGCGEVVCEPGHIRETVLFSLQEAPEPAPPFVQECADLAPKPGDLPAPRTADLPHIARRDARGVGELCRHCYGHHDRFEPCCPSELDCDCGCGCRIDCDAGVPLAYVNVAHDDCHLRVSHVRPVIGCCELTRIKDIGWRNWHDRPGVETNRRVFFDMFVPPPAEAPQNDEDDEGDEDDDSGEKGADYDGAPHRYLPVDTHFWVCFTAPVQACSLTQDAVSMTLAQADAREAVWNVVSVPITAIWCAPTSEGDPPGTTRGFRLMVQHEYWQGEIARGVAKGFQRPTQVEVRIHGSAIIDWAGRALDADSLARHLPSGNGSPGGEFVSTWRVRHHGQNIPPTGEIPDRADGADSQSAA